MAFEKIFSRDTGEWDVTALCGDAVSAGRLSVQRIDATTFLMADGLRIAKAPASGTSSVDLLPAWSLPSGLRPARNRVENILTGTGSLRRLVVSPAGWVPLYLSPQVGDRIDFTFAFPTPGPRPTTIPGVKL